jgi:basic membrane protein A and related proteins
VKSKRSAAVALALAATILAALAAVSVGTAARTAVTKVAIVTDTAGLNDKSFNHLANVGRLKAQKDLKISTRAFISKSSQDYLPNMVAAAQGGYGAVVAGGFLLATDLNTAAQQFKDVKWAIVDFPWVALTDKPKNAVGLTFKSEESGYLVGYLAGKMTQREGGAQVVSAVGGQKLPSVDNWIAGYRAGAKKANPKIKVLIDYSGQFPPSAAPKCKELALKQIAKGSHAIFQVAGGCGLGALDAAKSKGKWGIGVDADQFYLGSHILTSGVKRVDTAVYTFFKLAKAGTLKTGTDLVFNLKNGGQDVGKISPKCNCAAFVKQMNALKPLIISGKVKPPSKL